LQRPAKPLFRLLIPSDGENGHWPTVPLGKSFSPEFHSKKRLADQPFPFGNTSQTSQADAIAHTHKINPPDRISRTAGNEFLHHVADIVDLEIGLQLGSNLVAAADIDEEIIRRVIVGRGGILRGGRRATRRLAYDGIGIDPAGAEVVLVDVEVEVVVGPALGQIELPVRDDCRGVVRCEVYRAARGFDNGCERHTGVDLILAHILGQGTDQEVAGNTPIVHVPGIARFIFHALKRRRSEIEGDEIDMGEDRGADCAGEGEGGTVTLVPLDLAEIDLLLVGQFADLAFDGNPEIVDGNVEARQIAGRKDDSEFVGLGGLGLQLGVAAA